MISNQVLTGKIRHRSGWFGALVLQVEESITVTTDVFGSGHIDVETRLVWRDAKVSDLSQLEVLK